jgi:hypothetical protein
MRVPKAVGVLCLVSVLAIGLAGLAACGPVVSAGQAREVLRELGRARGQGGETRKVTILVDGREIPLLTEAGTVREALAQAEVALDDDDEVEPDLWVELEPGMTVRVLRVQQEIIVERELIPYRQQTVKSEALPVGETKLLQAGKNGQVEITYRLQFQDGVEISRSVLRRVIVEEPVNQIAVVGVEGIVDSVEIEGTIAYLSGGNAWLMRGASGERHPLTSSGNLDGRVFTLSPDGGYLLFTVITETADFDGPFNALYLLDVALADEEPQRLAMQDVLWAGWTPCGSGGKVCQQIAYSTGEKSGPPGWRANNDLWTVTLLNNDGEVVDSRPRRLLDTQTAGAYSWWGSRYAWSPDGRKIAYARPDQVGWIEVRSARSFPLASYPPQAPTGGTLGDQVWVPEPSWSPDSQFVALTVHDEEPGRPADESRIFQVWVLDLDHTVRARLTRSVGMWSAPRWSPAVDGESAIAYAVANTPSNSYESRYTLMVMDRDGSNKRDLFPAEGEAGMSVPFDHAWSPDGQRLVVLYLGNLYLLDATDGKAQQVTGDGQSTRVEWAN